MTHRRNLPSRAQHAGYGPEERALARGFRVLAGIDEVGRGPLAGPVVAAAVVLTPLLHGFADLRTGLLETGLDRIDDSKRVPAALRVVLAARICRLCPVGIATIPAPTIDRVNIRAASLMAMRQALEALPVAVDLVLIDGRDIPEGIGCAAEALVGGDHLSISIAAASIIAKVPRDRMMARADSAFPGYGFSRNAGYPTASHRAVLACQGPSPLHRATFGSVRKRNSEEFEG